MKAKDSSENVALFERRLSETRMKLQQASSELDMYQASLHALKNETKTVYINLGPVMVESDSTRPEHIRTIEETIGILQKTIEDNEQLLQFYEKCLTEAREGAGSEQTDKRGSTDHSDDRK